MKKVFYVGLIGLAIFEILNVYFIMPMPGSQRMNSLDLAYLLYSYRWFFRTVFGLMIVVGADSAFRSSKWIAVGTAVVVFVLVYMFNFEMAADKMFKQPVNMVFKPQSENILNDSSIVVGVENNGEVKAYPIQFIGYHHQVQDNVGGKSVIVTYCTVCRTGRVYEPIVKGRPEKFRLVGMDHFNAMFEDEATKSWWRQANGEAVTGPLKGELLPEVLSFQMSIKQLFRLYPNALVMQADATAFEEEKYDSLARYERGKSKNDLTRTDSLSWQEKSWVVGVELKGKSKAYDWNELKQQRVIHDKIGTASVIVILASDDQSFAAFKVADTSRFVLRNDSLVNGVHAYDLSGRNGKDPANNLEKVRAYQEFWHSWRTFHPHTERFDVTEK
jgi:hypothetical protein